MVRPKSVGPSAMLETNLPVQRPSDRSMSSYALRGDLIEFLSWNHRIDTLRRSLHTFTSLIPVLHRRNRSIRLISRTYRQMGVDSIKWPRTSTSKRLGRGAL